MSEIPLSKRVQLVRAAIERFDGADKQYRQVQADATSDADDRGAAKAARDAFEAEFAWQRENVRAILKHLTGEEI